MAGGRKNGDRGPSERELLERLRAIYDEVDRAFSGSHCDGTSECCRFALTGREPYVTTVELLGLRSAPRAKAKPPRLHLTVVGVRAEDDEGPCPFLGADGRCTTYAWRPLGCRTFFCERATHLSPVKHREVLGFVRSIQELARAHRGISEGTPLRRALLNEGRKRRP